MAGCADYKRPMYRVVATDVELDAAMPALELASTVALDTEFHPERTYRPRLLLVQLCVSGLPPLILDPLGGLTLRRLGPVLAQARLLVHGGVWDLRLLADHAGLVPRVVSDTQLVAAFAGLGWPRRLQDLLSIVLGAELDKGCTLSDWSRRPLSRAQLEYAAADVSLLAELDTALRKRVHALGNDAWLAAAEAEHVAEALAPVQPQRAWERVPGAHLLDDAARGTLRALAAWREDHACQHDVPLHQRVSDSALLDLARRRPRSADEMRENRRLPASVWKTHATPLLRMLAESAAPTPALPRGARADVLRAAARAAAASRGVSGDLLLRDCEIDYILTGSAGPSWRLAALGPEFLGFLDGNRVLDCHGALVNR